MQTPLNSTSAIIPTLTKDLKQTDHASLELIVSSNLNLAFIKGRFIGGENEDAFYRFCFSIKQHIILGRKINVFINLEFLDTDAAQLLVNLSEMNHEDNIVFFWNMEDQSSIKTQFESLQENSKCLIYRIAN